MDKIKEKQIRLAEEAVKKEHGDVCKWLSDMDTTHKDIISTGSLGLDFALCTGGFLQGRLVELFGPAGGGKSSLALSTIAQATKMGKVALFLDAEHALDPKLVRAFGVDENLFMYSTCYTGEQGLDIIEKFIASGSIDICVVDSVTSLLPMAEADRSVEDKDLIGMHAKLMSQMCRRLVPLIGKTNTLLVAINQLRTKIMNYGAYDDTTGGNAIKFYSSHRVAVNYSGGKNSSQIKSDKGNVVGHKTLFKVEKNKFGPPFRTAEADLTYGVGYELFRELFDIAVDTGVIDSPSKGWFALGEEKFRKSKGIEMLKEDRVFCKKVLLDVLNILGLENNYLEV